MDKIDYSPFKDFENYPLPIRENIQQLIVALRRQVLLQLVEDLVISLEAEGYFYHELIECLAHLADKRQLTEATRHLDKAVEKLVEIHNQAHSEGETGVAPASPSEE